jgi:hypothetical protein
MMLIPLGLFCAAWSFLADKPVSILWGISALSELSMMLYFGQYQFQFTRRE